MQFGRIGSFIDGKDVYTDNVQDLLTPVDGAKIADMFLADRDTVKAAIESSEKAFQKSWSHTTIAQRQKLIAKLAALIQEKSSIYSEMESTDTGKTLRQSMFMDIPLGISHIEYFANTKEFKLTRKIMHPEYPGTQGIVEHAPMGVVGAITPWNVPFLMAVWKLVPALLAGNTIVIKPSQNTPLTTLEFARDIKNAGFPDGVVNVVVAKGDLVGETFCSDDRISMISFTGSTSTGRRIMEMASKDIKRVALELGGKSPNVVLEDADIEHAAKGVLFGIFLNSGQLCESGSRLIVHNKVKDKIVSRVTKYLEMMKAGNPLDMETDVSAITTRDQFNKITEMVHDGITDESDLLYKKKIEGIVPRSGLYYPPTVVSIGDPKAELFREEIFGPVLAVTDFETTEEAIEIANDTEYGLASAIWSRDITHAKKIANRIEAGTVWINDYHLLSAAAPRGGFKKSGFGRELGLEGILEYTQTRHTFVNEKESDLDRVAYGLLFQE